MKVFAFLCTVAVAVSVPITEAATTTPKLCTEYVCAVTPAAAIQPAETIQISPPACPDSGKAYVVAIKYVGAANDLIRVATKDATGAALTNADAAACTTLTDASSQDIKAQECGKADANGVRVDLTCNNAVGTDDVPGIPCSATYSVTFACPAVDVAVTCNDALCTQANIKIPNGKKATYTPEACTAEGEKAYLKQITINGATGDKLTFVTKSAGTPLTDAACVDSTADATVVSGTSEAPLTCGKGLDSAITVEVSCARDDGTACAPSKNDVTFGCSAKGSETPAPSTGSMLTKANAIVGVISGMVGAIVYFNRG